MGVAILRVTVRGEFRDLTDEQRSERRTYERYQEQRRNSLNVDSAVSKKRDRAADRHKNECEHIGRDRDSRRHPELEHRRHGYQRVAACDHADRTGQKVDRRKQYKIGVRH